MRARACTCMHGQRPRAGGRVCPLQPAHGSGRSSAQFKGLCFSEGQSPHHATCQRALFCPCTDPTGGAVAQPPGGHSVVSIPMAAMGAMPTSHAIPSPQVSIADVSPASLSGACPGPGWTRLREHPRHKLEVENWGNPWGNGNVQGWNQSRRQMMAGLWDRVGGVAGQGGGGMHKRRKRCSTRKDRDCTSEGPGSCPRTHRPRDIVHSLLRDRAPRACGEMRKRHTRSLAHRSFADCRWGSGQ